MHEIFHELAALELPPDDYVIFGSGPLIIRGVIETTNDLDVVCRGAAWNAVCRLAPPRRVVPWNVDVVSLCEGRLTFGTEWAIGSVDPNELIDTAEMLEGLPFARLDFVVAYKRALGRPKDLEHLKLLAAHEIAESG